MSKIIEEETILEVWKKATHFLLDCPQKQDSNVFLIVKNPTSFDPSFFINHNPKTINPKKPSTDKLQPK